MKNAYIAVSIKENDKNYAYMIKVSEMDNLVGKLNIKGIEFANMFDTKKKAGEVVEYWNECYRKNGTYALGGTF